MAETDVNTVPSPQWERRRRRTSHCNSYYEDVIDNVDIENNHFHHHSVVSSSVVNTPTPKPIPPLGEFEEEEEEIIEHWRCGAEALPNKQHENVNEVDYRPHGGPLLRYLWCENEKENEENKTEAKTARQKHKDSTRNSALHGQTLYLGGEVGCDGNLYFIPGHASRVLQLSFQHTNHNNNNSNDDDRISSGKEQERVRQIGPVFPPGQFKWLRGVTVGEVIYGLPCHADCVLRIHVPTQHISTLPIPYEAFYNHNLDHDTAQQQRKQPWKYHGGSQSPINGCIYAIPQSALHVLKIDPVHDTVSLVGPPLEGRYKWYGSVVGPSDGAIYGIPHNAAYVLRILGVDGGDTSISLHGNFPQGGHKWHGAAVASGSGTIVAVPANADTVLCIQPPPSLTADPPIEPELYEIGQADMIRTGRHRSDSKYKYLGALAGTDGQVYCFPSGAEQVLQIDTRTRNVQTIGPNLFETQMERVCQNKWQNGVCAILEQAVYAVPLAAESVLRIDCNTTFQLSPRARVTTWPLPFPGKGLAKWEGAIVAPHGVMYTVPNNHKAILRIESPPAPTLPVSTDSTATRVKDRAHYALPYSSGIPTLRSSAHRVKCNLEQRRKQHGPRPTEESLLCMLPERLRHEQVLSFDRDTYPLHRKVCELLLRCDPNVVGTFRCPIDLKKKASTPIPHNVSDSSEAFSSSICSSTCCCSSLCRLEHFQVPIPSTWRSVNGGQCESAQQYLSEQMAQDEALLAVFDAFVTQVVLPHMKQTLTRVEAVVESRTRDEDEPYRVMTFYYQRPPTLRLQPGPAWAQVKAHHDAEYGHQNGELNFWVPLTDRNETGVDLWLESSPFHNDFHPVVAQMGQFISFHGSSCRHYVNPNASIYTRVSLDFRVGVEGFFDPEWEMAGSTYDHCRRQIRI